MNIQRNVVFALTLVGLWCAESFAASIIPHTRTKAKPGSSVNYVVYENYRTAGLSQPVTKKLKVLYDLAAPSYGAIKDTKMTVTTWGPASDALGYTEMTTEGHMYNGWSDNREPLMYRCWAVAAYNLYHYFYNKYKAEKTITFPSNFKPMTQDEMVFWGQNSGLGNSSIYTHPGYDAFLLQYGGSDAANEAVFRKMFNRYAQSVYRPNVLDIASILSDLKKDKPVYISVPQHAMLIDAVAEDSEKRKLVHCVNFDNHGTEGYVYFDQLDIEGWVAYEKPSELIGSDTEFPVDKDSDNDGLCDFDEKYRFKTNPNGASTDRDALSDSLEIHAKIIRLQIDINYLYDPNTKAIEFLNLSSAYDKKSGRALEIEEILPEKKSNTDGDSYSDGYEDKNRNGLWDEGETDPYLPDIDKVTVSDNVPGSYTIYSLGLVELGKNVECWNSDSRPTYISYKNERRDYRPRYNGCRIASEYKGNDTYAVDLRENAHAGFIDSKGKVRLGDGSVAPFVYFYRADEEGSMTRSNSAIGYGHVFLGGGAWQYVVTKHAVYDTGTRDAYVYSGETLTITPSTPIRSLIVESGGTLVLGNGDLYVGTITLMAGSKVKLLDNTHRTNLHTCGVVNWKAAFVKPSDADVGDMTGQFALIQHATYNVNIDNKWYGSIYAPKSTIRLGTTKGISAYGRFLGGKVSVREQSVVYYSPLKRPAYAKMIAESDVAEPKAQFLEEPNFSAEVSGNMLTVGNIPNGHAVRVVDAQGKVISKMVSNGRELNIMLPTTGLYIVYSGSRYRMLTVK